MAGRKPEVMKRYTVRKNKHRFKLWGWLPILPVLKNNLERVSWRVRFEDNCAYTLPGADQYDWNKGGGVSFDRWTNHTDAAMWGWRYNPETGNVELTAYCHIDGNRPFLYSTLYSQKHEGVKGEVCLECKPGDTVRIVLGIDRAIIEGRRAFHYDFAFMVEGSGESWPVGVGFNHTKTRTRTIGLWFGGNRKAPHRMDIFIKRVL